MGFGEITDSPQFPSCISKPQKIADSNFLGFKDWQQLKSAFFGGPSMLLQLC
ncbi:MAG: hypothetical protein LBS83_03720 [Holosporales bacterium]|nr:hypothetical protein [Holosporales bacterium]